MYTPSEFSVKLEVMLNNDRTLAECKEMLEIFRETEYTSKEFAEIIETELLRAIERKEELIKRGCTNKEVI